MTPKPPFRAMRPKPERPRKRVNMTLCIAASCEESNEKPRVVVGTDWRIEGAIVAGAEIQNKLYWITDDIFVLIAGRVTRAIELRDLYRELLIGMEEKNDPLTHRNIRRWIRAAPKIYRKRLVDEEVGRMMGGLTFAEFLDRVAQHSIPDTVAGPVFRRAEKVDLACSVIVVAHVDDAFYIFRVDDDGDVDECDNFAAIGEGIGIADGMLYLRSSNSEDEVSTQVYQVWEAMKMAAECISTVGKDITINVIYPPGEKGKHVAGDILTDEGEDHLAKLFKEKYGIRGFRRVPKLPKNALSTDFKGDEEMKKATRSTPQTSAGPQ